MRAYALAVTTLSLTLVLMLVGGIVHATGSSLACPDWPLCYGSAFPNMVGGVLFEHSHRLTASAVGVLTLALTVTLLLRWRGNRRWFGVGLAVLGIEFIQGVLMGAAVSGNHHPQLLAAAWALTALVVGGLVALSRSKDTLPVFGLAAFEVVVVQGLLGGLTVMMRLPTAVSTAHLATSMLFFATLVVIALRLRAGGTAASLKDIARRGPVLVAALGVYLQSILGALVRHTASGMACGDSLLTCDTSFSASAGAAHLHYTHRLLALVVMGVIVAATIPPMRAARQKTDDPRRGLVRKLAGAAHLLVTVQIGLGLLTVASFIALPLVTAHLGVAALLLGDLVALFVAMGPFGVKQEAGAEAPAGNLAGAAS